MDKRYLISLALIAMLLLVGMNDIVYSEPVSNETNEMKIAYVVFDKMVYGIGDMATEIIEDNDVEITLVAASKDPVEGMLVPIGVFLGHPWGVQYRKYTPQLTFDEINPEDYDAIVIAPGGSPEIIELSENEELLGLITAFDEEGKVVAASALSPLILLKAGVLNGKRYTVCGDATRIYPELGEAMNMAEKEGAVYVGGFLQEAVVDGNVITSSCMPPAAVKDYGEEIVKAIKVES